MHLHLRTAAGAVVSHDYEFVIARLFPGDGGEAALHAVCRPDLVEGIIAVSILEEHQVVFAMHPGIAECIDGESVKSSRICICLIVILRIHEVSRGCGAAERCVLHEVYLAVLHRVAVHLIFQELNVISLYVYAGECCLVAIHARYGTVYLIGAEFHLAGYQRRLGRSERYIIKVIEREFQILFCKLRATDLARCFGFCLNVCTLGAVGSRSA